MLERKKKMWTEYLESELATAKDKALTSWKQEVTVTVRNGRILRATGLPPKDVDYSLMESWMVLSIWYVWEFSKWWRWTVVNRLKCQNSRQVVHNYYWLKRLAA
jgi:hypothetical protein